MNGGVEMDAKEEIEAAIKMVQQGKLKPGGSAEKEPAEPRDVNEPISVAAFYQME